MKEFFLLRDFCVYIRMLEVGYLLRFLGGRRVIRSFLVDRKFLVKLDVGLGYVMCMFRGCCLMKDFFILIILSKFFLVYSDCVFYRISLFEYKCYSLLRVELCFEVGYFVVLRWFLLLRFENFD